MENYNLIWDSKPDKFRSLLLGKPIYDMKCNKCLNFIGAYSKPQDCDVKYCDKCGNKIEETTND